MLSLAQHHAEVLERIARAERQYGRPAGSVQLLGASKGQSVAAVRALAARGLRRFGESRVVEAIPKLAECADLSIEWHYIGVVQANKTAVIANQFAWVQSLDRARVALRLNAQRSADGPPLNVCVQVNLDLEATKAGVPPSGMADLAKLIMDQPRLRLRGVMSVPAPRKSFGEQREAFRRLADLYGQLQAAGCAIDTLSIGMSADFEAAIAEGATIVRIGTDLFGQRNATR